MLRLCSYLAAFLIAVFMLSPHSAQACGYMQVEDGQMIFHEAPCENSGPSKPVFTGTWYGAIAKAKSGSIVGGSQHASSRAAAESSAVAACRRKGGVGCSAVLWGVNNCLAMAASDNGAWSAQPSDYDRSDATTQAANDCRKRGGANCTVMISVCGRSPANGPQCIPYTPAYDTSRGEGWKNAPPILLQRLKEGPNGACKS